MNNKNEDQLPRWARTIRHNFSPYQIILSACECGKGKPSSGGGMCLDCAYDKISAACGDDAAYAYFEACKHLGKIQIKYDEYKSKQTKS